jgi:predicted ATPase
VFVRGVSGSGKTAVINTLRESVESDGGFFLAAKFDRFQHGDLYAVLSEVFSGLQNLDYSDELRESLRVALRDEGPLLGQIIPGLQRQLYSDSTRSLMSSSSDEKQCSTNARWSFQLLKILLRNFLKVLCRFHKIVFFLDDLQWSDKSYLDLVSSLLHDPELTSFLFVGSYRSNELDSDHQLFGHIEDLENMECSTKLKVTDLQPQPCNELIANLLHLDPEETEGLSAAVYRKTLGNAFFVLQFIQMLERSELLWYSFLNLKWEFDLPKITGETNLADNVVDAVVGKIHQLDVVSQNALKIAAGLGNRFDPLIIEYLLEKMPGKLNLDGNGIHEILGPCIEEDLIAVVEINLGDRNEAKKALYKFSHDKIHQASYSLISVRERSHFHLMLGRNL